MCSSAKGWSLQKRPGERRENAKLIVGQLVKSTFTLGLLGFQLVKPGFQAQAMALAELSCPRAPTFH
jgi:hypothetical protein